GDEVQQRRLAAAARAHERLERAARDVEVERLEHAQRLAASGELLRQTAELDEGLLRLGGARAVRGRRLGRGFCGHELFSLIACPSARAGGGCLTMRVPGDGPSMSSKPDPKAGPSFTGTRRTLPSSTT